MDKQFSLAARLASLYAVTAFATLLLASGSLYWVLLSHLEHEHKALLTEKLLELEDYLYRYQAEPRLLYHMLEVDHEPNGINHSSSIHPYLPHHVSVRIRDHRMRLIAETTHMQSVLNVLEFPHPRRSKDQTIPVSKSRMDAEHLFLVGSLWVAPNSANQQRVLIQAALELAQDEDLLSEYQHMLMAVLLAGVLLSTLGGFWVARKGLQPLGRITEAVQRVSVNQLDERINPDQWPQELGMLAEAFDEMLNRLDTSFAHLSQFSADLAHELRTPVNNLMGEAEVALSRPRNTEDYRQVLESSLEECSRMARMIDELLFLARAENPDTQINSTHLRALDELQAVRDFYEGIAEEQGVEIICRGDIGLYADASLLRRALGNLLSNALQYTPAGGTIEMRASEQVDYLVEVQVTDSGCGIDADKLPKIFDRFYRADSARARNTPGTGLGLAIVKSILELHGGAVKIASEPNQGTCITLIFPSKD